MCPAPGAALTAWRAGARAVSAPKATPAGSRSCDWRWIISPPVWMKSSSGKPRACSTIPGRLATAIWASTTAGRTDAISGHATAGIKAGWSAGAPDGEPSLCWPPSTLANACIPAAASSLRMWIASSHSNDIAFARRAISLVWQATGIDLETDFLADLALPRSSRTGRSGADLYRLLPPVGKELLPGRKPRSAGQVA